MKLIKNGVTFDVKSDIQIRAFLSSGYKEVTDTKKRGAANGDSKQ